MKSTHFLKALSLSVAALALNAGTAHATTVGIYGGGSTLSYLIDDVIGQSVGVQNASNPDAAVATGLGATAPVTTAYEYLLTATGSGAALTALTTNAPTTSGTKSGTVAVDSANGFGAYPYPSWQLSFSDAPLDTVTTAGGTTMFLDAYKTIAANRGQAWQIPVTAVGLAIPYNLPSATFGTTFYGAAVASATVHNGSTGPSATVPVLDLSTDMVCYIWTQKNAKGAAVSGAYQWDNAIFYGAKSASKTPKITNYDSNLVQSSVAGLAIKPVIRTDASGSTYLFTLWLKNNCKGYTTAGYSTPATLVTFPSFVLADGLNGNGGGALVGVVKQNEGAIGYVTPDAILPAKSSGAPAAFLLAGKSKVTDTAPVFLYPNPQNTVAAETGISLPTSIKAAKWGTKLNKTFFKAAKTNAGYPITGLTYVMGYTCYVNDSTNDELDGVKAYLNYLSNPTISTFLTNNGFAPLSTANYTSEIGTVVADLTGVSATAIVSGKKTITGPKACKSFTTAPQDYK